MKNKIVIRSKKSKKKVHRCCLFEGQRVDLCLVKGGLFDAVNWYSTCEICGGLITGPANAPKVIIGKIGG